MTPEVIEFGKALIREVRDRAISNCDALLAPVAKSPPAKRWREVLARHGGDEIAKTVIADCVDEVLFCLLEAIDSGALPLFYCAQNGKCIDLTKDGLSELSGWYMGSDGWRRQFSQERFFDDFSDLR